MSYRMKIFLLQDSWIRSCEKKKNKESNTKIHFIVKLSKCRTKSVSRGSFLFAISLIWQIKKCSNFAKLSKRPVKPSMNHTFEFLFHLWWILMTLKMLLMILLIFYLYISKFEQLLSAAAVLKFHIMNSKNFQSIFLSFLICNWIVKS